MSSGTIPANANGHRRRLVRIQVLVEESHCALCDRLVDKSWTVMFGQHSKRCANRDCIGCVPHPLRAEVDEDIPRSRGGSATERSNCHLMHRSCNSWKGTMTIAEARAKRAGVAVSETPNVITNLIRW